MKKYLIILFSILFCNNCSSQNTIDIEICKNNNIDKRYELGFVLSKRYIIYGDILKWHSPDKKEMSVKGLFDCQSNKNILNEFFTLPVSNSFFELPFDVLIERKDSLLTMTHFGKLPYGENWEMVDVAIMKQILVFSKEEIKRTKIQNIIVPKKITDFQINEVINGYEFLKSKGKSVINSPSGLDAFSQLIVRLFVCSLAGNKQCEHYFLNLEDDFPGFKNGVLGAIYYRWYGIYSSYTE